MSDLFAQNLHNILDRLKRAVKRLNSPANPDGLLAASFDTNGRLNREISWQVYRNPTEWAQQNAANLDQAPLLGVFGCLLAEQTRRNGTIEDDQTVGLFKTNLNRLQQRQNIFTFANSWALQPDVVLGVTLGINAIDDPLAKSWMLRLLEDGLNREIPLLLQLAYQYATVLLRNSPDRQLQLGMSIATFSCSTAELAMAIWLVKHGMLTITDQERSQWLENAHSTLLHHLITEAPYQVEDYKAAIIWEVVSSYVEARSRYPSTDFVCALLENISGSLNGWPIKWSIQNNSDVQSLLWMILRPYFDDLRRGEPHHHFDAYNEHLTIDIPSLSLTIAINRIQHTSEFQKISSKVEQKSIQLQQQKTFNAVIVFIYDGSCDIEQHAQFRHMIENIALVHRCIVACAPKEISVPAAILKQQLPSQPLNSIVAPELSHPLPLRDDTTLNSEDIPLILRFVPDADLTNITWEAAVLGRRASTFRVPYDVSTLPTVIKALDAIQWPNHPSEGPQFSQEERERLISLGFWESNHVVYDIQKRVGRTIYENLVTDPAGKVALATARDNATEKGLPLSFVLRFSPEAVSLAALPWEVLWDEHSALLLSRGKLASCVRYLDLDQALPPPSPPGSSLRVLAVAPKARIPADVRCNEQKTREIAWSELMKAGIVEVEELSPATPASLVDRIQTGSPVDIIHFYGHGRYNAGQGALLLDTPEGGEIWLSADKLATLFSGVRLIMLHACQSAMVGDEGLLTGVAPALSAAGVPAVVGMQLTVRIAAATRFAGIVYRSLARGESVQQAVSRARQALYVEENDSTSWFVPTLTIRARDMGPMRLVQK